MGIHSIPLHFKINITYKDSFFPSHNLCKYRSLASSPLHCGRSGVHCLQSLEKFSQSKPENNLSLVDDYDFASNVRNRTKFLDFYTNGAMYKLPNMTAWHPNWPTVQWWRVVSVWCAVYDNITLLAAVINNLFVVSPIIFTWQNTPALSAAKRASLMCGDWVVCGSWRLLIPAN